MDLLPLTAISPIDGRYAEQTAELRWLWSEYGLLRFRVLVEVRWLQTLSQYAPLKEIPPFSVATQHQLNALVDDFSLTDAQRIKAIEADTHHDVKAVEYFLKEKIVAIPELAKVSEFIHFACTSEDINNLAYALLLKTNRTQCLLPRMRALTQYLVSLAHGTARHAMLGRTHGQAAVPTTVGKELAVLVHRLQGRYEQFANVVLYGKFNGAVGNYNAYVIAYPDIAWQTVSREFVEALGLAWNAYTTQIEPHDYIAAYCDSLKHFNNVLIDLASDVWGYIALAYFKQKQQPNAVGSSTMPHKVNPIEFENAEANLSFANNLLEYFARCLPISRWQRDLRDSTLLRNLGVAFAHSLLAYQNLLQGLKKLTVNKQRLAADLDQHWEILAEAIQTVLRRYAGEMPYEKLKQLTCGQQLDQTDLHRFIQGLALPEPVKQQLLSLRPQDYLGYAVALAENI